MDKIRKDIPNRKNGKVELYRFLFCIFVLLFHIQKYLLPPDKIKYKNDIHFTFFTHGSVAVEFFFLLSGFLMAKSIYKSRKLYPETCDKFKASDGVIFLKKKYLSIFPQHIIAFIIVFISYLKVSNIDSFKEKVLALFDSIPNIFLIQMSGINFTNPNHIEWYISCMLIAMALIYPLCKRFYINFTRYIAPISAILIIGYMIFTTKSLTGVTSWTGLSYKSTLRAFAEISLGTTAFELSRYISEKKFTASQRITITVTEFICFVFVVLYMVLSFVNKYELYALIAMFLIITITFSSKTYGNKIFNNRVCCFLGKISLPIYLSQLGAINLVDKYFDKQSDVTKVLIAVFITFIFAFIVLIFGNLVAKLFNKKRTE